MSSGLAALAFGGFIVWLFVMDRQQRPAISYALWLPVIWAAIVGSRPVSFWFGIEVQLDASESSIEGSAFDRNLFLFLIMAGACVLWSRKIDWRRIVTNNKWMCAFFVYIAISALWSDYPFVSLKRWVKIFGNVVMVLVILTDKNPVQAVRAVLLRCGYLLIPLSVLFIKYYPHIGRGYARYTMEPICMGVTLGKNEFGVMVALCGLFLFWELVQVYESKGGMLRKIALSNYALLLLMAGWLLIKSNSATSLACSVLGSAGLVAMRMPAVMKRARNLLPYGIAALVVILVLVSAFDLVSVLAGLLGRDPTLTGRTEIWDMIFAEKLNPICGAGFYTFWLGSRVEKFWEVYSFHLNQAHNGYLETYLDGGLIGLGLLLGMLASAGRKIQKRLLVDPLWGSIGITVWLFAIVHNWTEASFARLSILWFALLVVTTECSSRVSGTRQGRSRQRSLFNDPEEAEASSPSAEEVLSGGKLGKANYLTVNVADAGSKG